MRIERAFGALGLALLATACSPADPVELIAQGHSALGYNDTKSAQAKFEAALRALQPGSADFIEAKLGLVQARIPSDGELARNEFIELTMAFPKLVGEKEFVFIGGQMVSARKFHDAVALLQAGTKTYGESSTLMAQIDRVKKEAVTNPDAAKALHSFGYL